MKKKLIFGYQATLGVKFIRLIINLLKKIFFLNHNNFFSNEFYQNSNLTNEIFYNKKKLIFKTGHGRLNWRVNSFYSEEPMMIEWINKFSRKDVFLDIGANVGIYSVAVASKGLLVYSAELDPKNISILFENIHLNKLHKNCLILPFALNDKNEIVKIYYRDFSIGDALQSLKKKSKLPTRYGDKFEINQISFSLDQIFKLFKLKQPSKIKIDVDGNEKVVVLGGKKIISRAKEIYIEDNGISDDFYIKSFLKKNKFKEISKLKINKSNNKNIYNRIYRKS